MTITIDRFISIFEAAQRLEPALELRTLQKYVEHPLHAKASVAAQHLRWLSEAPLDEVAYFVQLFAKSNKRMLEITKIVQTLRPHVTQDAIERFLTDAVEGYAAREGGRHAVEWLRKVGTPADIAAFVVAGIEE